MSEPSFGVVPSDRRAAQPNTPPEPSRHPRRPTGRQAVEVGTHGDQLRAVGKPAGSKPFFRRGSRADRAGQRQAAEAGKRKRAAVGQAIAGERDTNRNTPQRQPGPWEQRPHRRESTRARSSPAQRTRVPGRASIAVHQFHHVPGRQLDRRREQPSFETGQAFSAGGKVATVRL